MDTEAIRVFVEVMRSGSFAAVARARNVDPSSISRVIAGLEDDLKVRLFQRTTRSLSPTDAARAYFERVEALVEQLDQAAQEATDSGDTPRGTVRVTVIEGFAQVALVPLLPEFFERYPEVTVELMLASGFLDLVEERADMAIRLGKLHESSHIAHRILDFNYTACASPAYLKRRGRPSRPEELAEHECLYYPYQGRGSCWRFRCHDGVIVEVSVRGRVVANGGLVLRGCALRGMGVPILPRWMIGDDLAAGRLVELFPEWDATATEFDLGGWVLYPSRAYLPRRVRVLSDFLREKFAPRRR
jgi:DNA-binding transcriptional LysR family regulator